MALKQAQALSYSSIFQLSSSSPRGKKASRLNSHGMIGAMKDCFLKACARPVSVEAAAFFGIAPPSAVGGFLSLVHNGSFTKDGSAEGSLLAAADSGADAVGSGVGVTGSGVVNKGSGAGTEGSGVDTEGSGADDVGSGVDTKGSGIEVDGSAVGAGDSGICIGVERSISSES